MTERRRHYYGEKSGTPWDMQVTVVFLVAIIGLTYMSQVATARSWVKIWNNIGPGQRLWVACYYELFTPGFKSPVTLNYGEVYYIRFRQVRLTSSHWWCSFEWENNHRNQTFIVWDRSARSTMPVKCAQCLWAARPKGFYVWDKEFNKFKFYKSWLKPELPTFDDFTAGAHNSRK